MSISLDFRSPFVPPVVDSLAVRVVVDSRYERFLPKSHAVVGRFHLGMASPEYIQHSVDELAALSRGASEIVCIPIFP
jgi:hypothetical protein